MTIKTTRKTSGLDTIVVASHPARDATHFRRVLAARQGVAAADQELDDAVRAAREAGDSWTTTGAALDTTRHAVYQRFGKD